MNRDDNNRVTEKRGFGLRSTLSDTVINIFELSDGTKSISLITPSGCDEPFVTTFRLTQNTFNLLCDAMLRAAHDPNIWHEAKE